MCLSIMNDLIVFEFSSKSASQWYFYFPCTLKINKAIALQSRPGFFGTPCTVFQLDTKTNNLPIWWQHVRCCTYSCLSSHTTVLYIQLSNISIIIWTDNHLHYGKQTYNVNVNTVLDTTRFLNDTKRNLLQSTLKKHTLNAVTDEITFGKQ